jgi:hypothetical protein
MIDQPGVSEQITDDALRMMRESAANFAEQIADPQPVRMGLVSSTPPRLPQLPIARNFNTEAEAIAIFANYTELPSAPPVRCPDCGLWSFLTQARHVCPGGDRRPPTLVRNAYRNTTMRGRIGDIPVAPTAITGVAEQNIPHPARRSEFEADVIYDNADGVRTLARWVPGSRGLSQIELAIPHAGTVTDIRVDGSSLLARADRVPRQVRGGELVLIQAPIGEFAIQSPPTPLSRVSTRSNPSSYFNPLRRRDPAALHGVLESANGGPIYVETIAGRGLAATRRVYEGQLQNNSEGYLVTFTPPAGEQIDGLRVMGVPIETIGMPFTPNGGLVEIGVPHPPGWQLDPRDRCE